jgi:hypothetical protein
MTTEGKIAQKAALAMAGQKDWATQVVEGRN